MRIPKFSLMVLLCTLLSNHIIALSPAVHANHYAPSAAALQPQSAAAQSPYGGTVRSIPGKIEAEHYDLGGQNVAYYDNSSGNTSGAFRTEDVDIEATTDAGGGYNISYIAAGEWLKYTVNVTAAGLYTLQVRVAAWAAGKTFHIEMDGVNISGTIAIPNTGGYQNWQTVTVNNISLTAGQKVMRIYMDASEFNLNSITFTQVVTNKAPTVSLTAPVAGTAITLGAALNVAANAADADGAVAKVEFFAGTVKIGEDLTSPYSIAWTPAAAGTYSITARATDDKGVASTSAAVGITVKAPTPVQSPYGGTVRSIPGRIEAEYYDLGGQGVAYNDNTAGNTGAVFRTEGVDLEACTDAGSGYNVAYVGAGEWVEYTVNVTAAGTYNMEARVAADSAGNIFHVDLDGTNISGAVTVPNTLGWQSWQSIYVNNLTLTAGQKIMRVYFQTGNINLNYIAFTQVIPNKAPSVSLTAPLAGASVAQGTAVTISANATDADGTVSKVEFFAGTTKIGEDLTSPYSIAWTPLASGTYSLTAKATDNSGAVTTSAAAVITVNAPAPAQSPYGGTVRSIPGKIEAEHYDLGGQGVAYYDNTSGNTGAAFRTDAVDVEACTDAGTGYDVAYIAPGEWLEYTVNVVTAGTYNFEFRVATDTTLSVLRVAMDGVNLGGPVSITNTGGWQVWQTVTLSNVALTAGQKVMRLFFETGNFNLNYINVVKPVTITTPFKVVGYMPTWSGDVNTIQYSKLTHLNYAFILPTATGGLTSLPGASRLQSLVSLAHAKGVKVSIAVGGWNDGDDSAFESLAANTTYINTFVNNLLSYVTTYNLDGVDIDWEYPDAGASATNYAKLMSALSTALHDKGKILSAAVISRGSTGDAVLPEVFGYVDHLNLMAYDAGTPHSPYSEAVASLDYWLGRGLPEEKAILGVPFYGSSPYTSYATLVSQDAQAPYKDNVGTVYYNGIQTIKDKTNLARQRGGGIMIWELSQDTQGTTSLLSAINDAVIAAGTAKLEAVQEAEGQLMLYPNPVLSDLTLAGLEGEGEVHIIIFDALGYKVTEQTLHEEGSWEATLALHSLPAGMYVVRVTGGKKVQTGKFIKE